MKIKSMCNYLRIRIGLTLLAISAAVIPALGQAEESSSDSGWQFALTPYLWGSDVSGKTQSGSQIDVSIDELVDNLEMAFMIAFEARKDKWSFLLDMIYLDLATSTTKGPLNINMDLEGLVTNVGAGYNVLNNNRSRLDVIAAFRNLDLDFKLTTNTPAGDEQSGNNLDVILGVKGQYSFAEKWYIPYYLDIGGGNSDFTWQALAGINFRAAKWVDIALVYRHLEWDFKPSKVLDDVSFSGPALGAIFRF